MRSHLREPLFRGAYALIASTVLTAVLGIAFWAVAARTSSPAAVGRDAALISSMIALSAICQLNLVDAIVRFLPGVKHRDRARRIGGAYGAALGAGLLGATAFVLVGPLSFTPWLAVAFVAATAVWGVFVLQDAVLTALRRATWLPAENAGFSVAKIALLGLLAAVGGGHAVFLAWVLPLLLFVPLMNVLLWARVLRPAARTTPEAAAPRASLRGGRMKRFMAADYAGFVLGQGAITLLPLIVVARLGEEQNAFFYMPFTLIVAFDLLFYNVTTSMTVEGAYDERRTAALVRTVARRFLALQIPAALAIVAAAPLLLAPFGEEYASEGASALRLLACASVARAVCHLFIALARVHGRGGAILLAQGTIFAIVCVLALALAGPLGLDGVALAWLAGNGIVALAAAPTILRTIRSAS
ncbi:MAG TPA: hypothetical protein VFZ89_16930 [Solirubrobacteraceae bacterium]